MSRYPIADDQIRAMSEPIALLPCPFCGGEGENLSNGYTGTCWVRCCVADCGCEGPVCDGESDAINAWNTRDLRERLLAFCNGHPYAKIEWPHRILHEAVDEIDDLRKANTLLHGFVTNRDAEIARLNSAKTAALKIADERAKEAVELRADRDKWHRVAMDAGAITCIGGGNIFPLRDEIAGLRSQLASARKALEAIEKRDRMWTAFPGQNEILDETKYGSVQIRGECGQIAHVALTDESRQPDPAIKTAQGTET